MIKKYRERKFIEAVKFDNTFESIQEIINFVGLPVNVEYTSTGVQMRIIRSAYNVVIAKVGEYVIKAEDGTLGACTPEYLAEHYDEVTA